MLRQLYHNVVIFTAGQLQMATFRSALFNIQVGLLFAFLDQRVKTTHCGSSMQH